MYNTPISGPYIGVYRWNSLRRFEEKKKLRSKRRQGVSIHRAISHTTATSWQFSSERIVSPFLISSSSYSFPSAPLPLLSEWISFPLLSLPPPSRSPLLLPPSPHLLSLFFLLFLLLLSLLLIQLLFFLLLLHLLFFLLMFLFRLLFLTFPLLSFSFF